MINLYYYKFVPHRDEEAFLFGFYSKLGLTLTLNGSNQKSATWCTKYFDEYGSFHCIYSNFRLQYDDLVCTIISCWKWATNWLHERPSPQVLPTTHIRYVSIYWLRLLPGIYWIFQDFMKLIGAIKEPTLCANASKMTCYDPLRSVLGILKNALVVVRVYCVSLHGFMSPGGLGLSCWIDGIRLV